MRVLVTGHEGYIGSVLVPMLTAAGHDVVGLDVGYYRDGVLGPPPPEVKAYRVDLRDAGPEHCLGMDAVIHLGGLCNDPVGNLDPRLTYAINHAATLRLARAARRAGVPRFLFASSCSLYGASAGAPLLDETAPMNPVTPYGESKAQAEAALRELADDRFCPVMLRNATAYGYSPRLRGDLVVNDLVGQALFTGEVVLRSDGSAWRPLVHVADIAAAFVAMLEAPVDRIRGRAFHVGQTSENYRIIDVARMVTEAVPGSRLRIASGATADRRDYRVSCERIATEIPNFRPRWTLQAGIRQLIEAYRRFRLRYEDLMGPRHQRLARLYELRKAGRIDSRLRWVGP